MSMDVNGPGGSYSSSRTSRSETAELDTPGGSNSRTSTRGDYSSGGNDRTSAGDGRPSDWMGGQGPSKEEVSIYKADKGAETAEMKETSRREGQESAQGSKERINVENNNNKLAMEDKKNEFKAGSEERKYQAEADRDARKAEMEKGKQEHALKLDEQNHKQDIEKLKLQSELKDKDDKREHDQFKELAPERDKDRQAKMDLLKMTEETKRYEANQAKQASKHG